MTVTKSIKTGADMVTVQSAIGRVDEVAVSMERKWGVDRLPRLVSQQMAEAFHRQAQKFNDAIWNQTPADVVEQAQRMINAWTALDQDAVAAGKPVLAPTTWETPVTIDDKVGVLAVVPTQAEALAVQREGRHLHVVTLEAVAKLIEAQPTLCQVFKTFEDAAVIDVRKKCNERPLDDSIEEVVRLFTSG